jgi:hypothetical protein
MPSSLQRRLSRRRSGGPRQPSDTPSVNGATVRASHVLQLIFHLYGRRETSTDRVVGALRAVIGFFNPPYPLYERQNKRRNARLICSVRNPHAAFDVEGAGNVARHRPKPARQSSTLPMRGMWRRSHGRATEAPPDERGGNRHARPTATAPHPDSTLLSRSAWRPSSEERRSRPHMEGA